jgi:hypothetical protein
MQLRPAHNPQPTGPKNAYQRCPAGHLNAISQRTKNMSQGPYDDGTQFLLDTMHNPRASLRHRIECAKTLLELHPNEFNVRWVDASGNTTTFANAPTVRIIIQGIGPTPQPAIDDKEQLRLN